MAIDKICLVSTLAPSSAFLAQVNRDLFRSLSQRRFKFKYRQSEFSVITEESRCTVSTKKGITPAFSLLLNYGVHQRYLLELNPATLPNGAHDLTSLLKEIGWSADDLQINRLDLCADLDLPVEYLYRTLRVPNKRVTEVISRSVNNRGVQGYYVGKNPATLRVYNKLAQLKRFKNDAQSLPAQLTRVEWEFRGKKCPVRRLSQLPKLLEIDPFECIEILESEAVFDFHGNTKASLKRFNFNQLAKEFGAQEACRILGHQRHFKRDFGRVLVNRSEIKKAMCQSYIRGLQLFFQNQPSDLIWESTAS